MNRKFILFSSILVMLSIITIQSITTTGSTITPKIEENKILQECKMTGPDETNPCGETLRVTARAHVEWLFSTSQISI